MSLLLWAILKQSFKDRPRPILPARSTPTPRRKIHEVMRCGMGATLYNQRSRGGRVEAVKEMEFVMPSATGRAVRHLRPAESRPA